jgi:hypothetical protein
MTDRNAVMRTSVVSGSRSPSTRPIPSKVGRHVQASPVEPSQLVALDLLSIDHVTPMHDGSSKVAHPEAPRGLHQKRLGAIEVIGMHLAGAHECGQRGGPDLTGRQRPPGRGHRPERSGGAHVVGGHRERHPEPLCQPRRNRQVAVPDEGPAPLDLGDPPERLAVQQIGGSEHFTQIRLERVVVDGTEVVRLQLLDRRPQCAHAAEPIERVFVRP